VSVCGQCGRGYVDRGHARLIGGLSAGSCLQDRPDRKFGRISMEDLAKAWAEGSDSFASIPPSAILNGTYTDEDGTKKAMFHRGRVNGGPRVRRPDLSYYNYSFRPEYMAPKFFSYIQMIIESRRHPYTAD
jgi:hypothetical protein